MAVMYWMALISPQNETFLKGKQDCKPEMKAITNDASGDISAHERSGLKAERLSIPHPLSGKSSKILFPHQKVYFLHFGHPW